MFADVGQSLLRGTIQSQRGLVSTTRLAKKVEIQC